MIDHVAARGWMMENDLSFSGEWRCCETWLRLSSDDPEATCPECETTYTASVGEDGTLQVEPGRGPWVSTAYFVVKEPDRGRLDLVWKDEVWRIEPGQVPALLSACLEAYQDPETGMSGREMLDAFAYPSGQPYDRPELVAALRRLLGQENP